MKRILAIVLTLVMMLTVLTGCTTPETSAGLAGKQTRPSKEQEMQPSNPPSAAQKTQPSILPSAEPETQPSIPPRAEPETKPSNPPVSGESIRLKIDSLDKLNYYAALRLVTGTPTLTKQSMTGGSYGVVMLAAGDESVEAPTVPDATELTATEGPPVAPDNPNPTNPGEDIIYYKLKPNQSFNIKKVNMFQIELTDENGFLASKLGLGVVDVVITEGFIWGDSLITFRNGDKFFSCLTNGYGQNPETGARHWNFSTHKYVEGFNIVKNFRQENYAFYIRTDAERQIVAFECGVSQLGGNRVDQNVKIVSATRISTQGGRITVAELEAYLNNGSAV